MKAQDLAEHMVEPPPDLSAHYVGEGWWDGSTLTSLLDTGLRSGAGLRFAVHSLERPYDGTIAEVAAVAARLRTGLQRRGLGEGDIIAFQLPNWMEAAAAFWALAELGAVLLPIPHFYGRRELVQILRETEARALIVAASFGARDYAAELESVRGEVPALEHLVLVGAAGSVPRGMVRFEDVLADTASPPPLVRIRPEDPAVVGYTSGTGAAPKGVVLTHRAMAFDTTFHIGRAYTTTRPILNGSPVTHMAGMLVSLLVPAVRDDEIHLIDKWEPGRVLEIMRRENLTSGWGAAIFLTSLVDHPDAGPEDLARIERCYLGGSPIPAALVARVEAQGIWVGRGYGCTEQPTVTFSRLDDPYDKRVHTNGRVLTGVEIITVDDDGRELSPGTDGELLIRGPDRFSGYMDANLTAAAIDKDGWFRTGDIGFVDEDGYLQITDRVKDIIIRGGENISAAEIEELLLQMPVVSEVAVVAAPDPTYGERACAMVRVKPDGGDVSLEAVRTHLAAAGLARQKWPESVRVVDEFPRTPSGKIKKAVLREQLRQPGSS